ncbi:ATP-binding protein [Streptomyces sp. URMC 125]|uniref:ATP-binding protein n=1 Tax=Streptomyces sp. URMC 125 TaxID=3423419 RepID=UPI003F1C6E4C
MAPVSGGVRTTVRDSGTTPPVPRPPDLADGTGGFGWSIVQRLAHRLEVLPRPDGKEIRAVLPW